MAAVEADAADAASLVLGTAADGDQPKSRVNAASGQQHVARFSAAQDACQNFMHRFQQQKKVDPFAGQPSFSIGTREG
jgi:hypothetical protein